MDNNNQPEDGMSEYQNILCVTDFSAASKRGIVRAVELAGHYQARLSLLHVIEHFPEDRSNEVIAPENVDPASFRQEKARSALAAIAKECGCESVRRELLVSSHSAGKPIVRFAEEHNTDLIVIGSHGHHGLAAILGSTANTIMHSAPCDVLAVRAAG
jgi:universal stress protein A